MNNRKEESTKYTDFEVRKLIIEIFDCHNYDICNPNEYISSISYITCLVEIEEKFEIRFDDNHLDESTLDLDRLVNIVNYLIHCKSV